MYEIVNGHGGIKCIILGMDDQCGQSACEWIPDDQAYVRDLEWMQRDKN